jgi:hypothetical protein
MHTGDPKPPLEVSDDEVNSFATASRAASSSVMLALAAPVTHHHSTPREPICPAGGALLTCVELVER